MARWWSSTRKPSTSSGENDTTGTGMPEAEGGAAAAASSSRLKRTLFRSHRAKKEEAAAAPDPTPVPRPFTQQNLEHQKILGAFTWTTAVGRRKSSRGAHSCASGVSPSTSRTTSVDDGTTAGGPPSPRSSPRGPVDRRSLSGRLRRSLADAPPREAPGRPSDQDRVPTAVLPGGVFDAHRRS